MTTVELMDVIFKFLLTIELRPIKSNKCIQFEYKTHILTMFFYENDPNYFSVIKSFECKEYKLSVLLKLLNELLPEYKAIRSYINNNTVYFEITCFIYEYNHLNDIFRKILVIMVNIVSEFEKKIALLNAETKSPLCISDEKKGNKFKQRIERIKAKVEIFFNRFFDENQDDRTKTI